MLFKDHVSPPKLRNNVFYSRNFTTINLINFSLFVTKYLPTLSRYANKIILFGTEF